AEFPPVHSSSPSVFPVCFSSEFILLSRPGKQVKPVKDSGGQVPVRGQLNPIHPAVRCDLDEAVHGQTVSQVVTKARAEKNLLSPGIYLIDPWGVADGIPVSIVKVDLSQQV